MPELSEGPKGYYTVSIVWCSVCYLHFEERGEWKGIQLVAIWNPNTRCVQNTSHSPSDSLSTLLQQAMTLAHENVKNPSHILLNACDQTILGSSCLPKIAKPLLKCCFIPKWCLETHFLCVSLSLDAFLKIGPQCVCIKVAYLDSGSKASRSLSCRFLSPSIPLSVFPLWNMSYLPSSS